MAPLPPAPLPTPLPGCKSSLIDNILINSTENHILSGVLQFRVSHHFPIFNVFTCPILNAQANSDKNVPSYDFCESNIENLRNHLTEKISEAFFDYNSQANFCNFIEIIHDTSVAETGGGWGVYIPPNNWTPSPPIITKCIPPIF